jgi:hypothetical protein
MAPRFVYLTKTMPLPHTFGRLFLSPPELLADVLLHDALVHARLVLFHVLHARETGFHHLKGRNGKHS